MSPELETLDQLQAYDLLLSVVIQIYDSEERFRVGIHGLLTGGDVRLLNAEGAEIPSWRWRELFVEGQVMNLLDELSLSLTDRGAAKKL